MLRRLMDGVTLAAFACLVAGLVFVEWGMSSVQPHHQYAKQQSANRTESRPASVAAPKPADERIADYTWWLSAFTLALVVVSAFQIGFLIRADKTARIAANSAKASADAATAIEFPVIKTSWLGPELLAVDELIRPHVVYGGIVNDQWPTRFSGISYVTFHNYGRTPGFPSKIAMSIAVTKTLPMIPVYNHVINCEPHTVIKGMDDHAIEIHFGFELSDADQAAIKNATAILWFYILLTYNDVMERTTSVGFCWQWGRQNEADSISYFFDDGSAPAAYTRKT